MADEAKVATPNEVVNEPATPAADVVEPQAPAEEKEKTVSEVLSTKEPEREAKVVPESVFLGEKKARKALEKEVKDLREKITAGGTNEEVSSDIESIADKFGVDKQFLNELSKTFKQEARRELEAEMDAKVRPL